MREEIAGALKRDILLIPVLVERAPLPRAADLPDDIRAMVLHQKHDISYERFGRNIEQLVVAIKAGRQAMQAETGPGRIRVVPWAWIGATATIVLAVGWLAASLAGMPVTWPWSSRPAGGGSIANIAPPDQARAADESKRLADLTVQVKQQQEARQDSGVGRKADEEDVGRVPKVGQTFRDCSDGCPEMVVVPAGEFIMGSLANEAGRDSDEEPQRKVVIGYPLVVGKFEVTFAEWEACVAGGGCTSNRSPSDKGWGRGRRPVINVSWNDAKEYVSWLSRKTGKTYRLLSEAEWEYAARAGTTTPFFTGATITTDQANFDGNHTYGGSSKGEFRQETIEVGSFPANAFGLHDVHGNVWEWVEDAWHPNYQGAPNDGSVWRGGDPSLRILRGGSWNYDPDILRSADRGRLHPDDRSIVIGFRVSRAL